MSPFGRLRLDLGGHAVAGWLCEMTRFTLRELERLSKSRERERVWVMLVFAVFHGELGREHDHNNQMEKCSPDPFR